jgi:cyanophycinase-like exopeptidase
MQDGWSTTPREIAIDEKCAVLVEADGKAKVVSTGKGAYFLRPTHAPELCKKDEPLTFRNVDVTRVKAGGTFDLDKWTRESGTSYALSVVTGKIESTQPNHSTY